MARADAAGSDGIDPHGVSNETPAPVASPCCPSKEILLLRDVAKLFDLPNPRAALRFLRDNSLPMVKLGRRLVVVRSALVDELRQRSRADDRASAVAAVVQRLAPGRRTRASPSSVPKLLS
jgi:hypothetical protein